METRQVIERLDHLENHFKVYKNDMQDVKDGIKEMKLLLGGSALNGNKGFIHLMEKVEGKVDTIEMQIKDMQKDLESVRFWGRGAAGLLFSAILIIFSYIKDKI